jgi:hypothetical protein
MRIFIILLALIAAPAWAEWVQVGETDGVIFLIDPATIRRDDDLSQVLELQDLRQTGKQGEMSRRILMEYKCNEERHRLLSLTMHSEPMAEGKVLVSVSRASDWYNIVSGTSAAATLRQVCAK